MRRNTEAAANAARRAAQRAKADEKSKMKGRNKPTRRQKKKQLNIIEDQKPVIRTRIQEEVGWRLCCSHSHGWCELRERGKKYSILKSFVRLLLLLHVSMCGAVYCTLVDNSRQALTGKLLC